MAPMTIQPPRPSAPGVNTRPIEKTTDVIVEEDGGQDTVVIGTLPALETAMLLKSRTESLH
ncbi:hypothetical protein J2S64_003611 [Paeniglutamicibacter sulfureus]|uniref:Uncharacterized protein n=1 Tax=Paeniglutamicibacter sulfureus TaxID=43666 RepID=A0ABU2BMQ0_9MICC|nr:hypothetical protein [Paeniglutamicibacter sulfureus]